MTINERILADKRSLKNAGYRGVELEQSYNYFDNWESAVMIYSVKTEKGMEIKYSFPKRFDIKKLYTQNVERYIVGEIDHFEEEYERFGVRWTIIVKRDDGKHIYNCKVTPDFETVIKETKLEGAK